MTSFEEGTARHSMHHADPPLHILMPLGSEMRTWCGGGLADKANTVNRVRCPRCTTLLREGVEDGSYDETELKQWLASTFTTRRLGAGRARRQRLQGG